MSPVLFLKTARFPGMLPLLMCHIDSQAVPFCWTLTLAVEKLLFWGSLTREGVADDLWCKGFSPTGGAIRTTLGLSIRAGWHSGSEFLPLSLWASHLWKRARWRSALPFVLKCLAVTFPQLEAVSVLFVLLLAGLQGGCRMREMGLEQACWGQT